MPCRGYDLVPIHSDLCQGCPGGTDPKSFLVAISSNRSSMAICGRLEFENSAWSLPIQMAVVWETEIRLKGHPLWKNMKSVTNSAQEIPFVFPFAARQGLAQCIP